MLKANLNGRPLYAKGTMHVKCFDPATNDLVYFSDNVSTNQLQSSVNAGAINAGPGNPVVIQIPDSPNLTMNLTSADFSLAARALSVGGQLTYNGVVPIDEVVEADGTTLTVAQPPVAPLGGCDVIGYIGNDGTAYTIDITTRQVQGFTAEAGQKYCVHYYTTNAGAQQFGVDTLMSPAVVRTLITIPVYATDSNETNPLKGSQVGALYITIPRMQFNGDVSTDGSQTTPVTTALNGTALSYKEACEAGIQCGSSASPKLAYMVLELFGDPEQFVTGLAIVGGNDIDVTAGQTAPIALKYVMEDGSLGTPLMSNFNFVSAAPDTATVSAQGVVTGVAAGTTTITITGKGTKQLTTTANVTVTAA